ncbi:MAG: ABC transporter ATP-binding protein [Candidatus Ventricola sp.]|nr:ABC transporter ATP-binding protein [Candidatus Ventricola sp.]
MIDVRNLSFSYGVSPVLCGLTFTVEEGGLTALLGCNGAGKTTLFRCMLGMLPGYGGSLTLCGREIRRYRARELAQRIAWIPQSQTPAFSYPAFDMVLMGTTGQTGLFASPGRRQRETAMEAMERLGIAHLAGRSFLHLSGGERQLVLIARALAQQARVLLMDEPCASLDFGNQSRVMAQARELAHSGYTVIMSTHHPQHVLSYADRVIALSGGRLLKSGTPDEVMDEALMCTLYGIETAFVDSPVGRIVVAGRTA